MTPENRKRLADIIEAQKDEILEEWRTRVRPLLSKYDISTPILNNEMPDFLDELTRRIRDIDVPYSWDATKEDDREIETTAVNHGRQRFEAGYDIVEVIKEYGLLREVVIDRAESEGVVIGGKGGHVFNYVFNHAAATAVETFESEKRNETLRRRKEYLAVVMHDLKTPLNAIMIAAHVIEEAVDKPDVVTEMAQIIVRSGERLDEFLQDTIRKEKSGLNEGIEDLIIRPFELWPLVQSVMDEHRVLAEESHTSLLNLVPANFTMSADAVALKTVFRNLISNAIKYTAGGKITTGVSTSRKGMVECWVRDTGSGIPTERIGTLFEGKTDPSHKGSTGLGLITVKKLVEAHGGCMTVESMPGEGTTVRIFLPCKPRPENGGV